MRILHPVFVFWTVTSAVFQETGSKPAGNATIVMIVRLHLVLPLNLTDRIRVQFLYYAFYDIAYTPLLVVYAIEILPFQIRAKGFAFMVCPTLSPYA